VVVIAPRRYGKTSLVHQVLRDMDIPYTIMELTMALSLQDVEHIILRHVSDLLQSLLPTAKRAKQLILNLFRWLNPELILTAAGQKLVFRPDVTVPRSAENICEILKKLDDAATIAGKRVVVVMDEFQQLTEIRDHALEAAIRHAMQYSRNVTYVFSGSNRHMLLAIFNSKSRPFYNSCEMMRLERISRDEYLPFIQQAAEKTWGTPLEEDVIDHILELTERHPSYVNRICGHFWLTNEPPTKENVSAYWETFVESKRSEFTEDILRLSRNQRRALWYFALYPTSKPSNKNVCQALELPEASVRQATRKLILDDYLCKDAKGVLRVLDPALGLFLKNLKKY
jgi:hypothetical protein